MQQTLTLAKRGLLTVSPNPMVGCIVVKNGVIVGEGWHQKAGEPHAEVYALQQAGDLAKNSTVYVSLEPCCHTGRTAPCVDALINAKVSKVVVATLDPNPKVAGNGVLRLQNAGITVELGLLEKQARKLNKIFFHYQISKRPYVFAKWAMSLDGKMAVNDSDNKQISSEKSREYTHQIRNICDAIIIGKKTLLEDNPKLDERVGALKASNPKRFVIFSKLTEINSQWHILDTKVAETVFVCAEISDIAKEQLQKLDIEYWLLPNTNNRVCLNTLISKMGEQGITSLLVEGGNTLLSEFISKSLVDEFITYISPVMIANLNPKQNLGWKVSRVGGDILVNAKIKGESDV